MRLVSKLASWGRPALCARRLLALLVLGAMAGCAGGREGESSAEEETLGGDSSAARVLEIGPSIDPIGPGDTPTRSQGGPCEIVDTSAASLAKQSVNHRMPWTRVLYSWTVPEQEAGLRSRLQLLTVGAIPETRRGLAMDLLAERALENSASLEALVNENFEEFRYAWPNPWATRIGPGGEDYGNRLIKMVLKDEAWLGMLSRDGSIDAVFNQDGEEIPLEHALENSGRIAVLYFSRSGPSCGTFGGGGGYREFIVGNEAMLEEWSIGTAETLDRLNADVEALLEYATLTRSCPLNSTSALPTFAHSVSCRWGYDSDPYVSSLALPSEAYNPTPQNLVALIETLEGDRFEPDPLVVYPE